MAVIGKIRKRTGLLITIIAIAILGFLLMDATNSQSGVIRPGSDVVGQVSGAKINTLEFETLVKQKEEERKAQKGSTRAQLTDEERRSVREETWNEFVEAAVMDDLMDKIGLDVTGEEVEDMIVGSIPHPFVVSQFTNPQTGQFDPMQVRGFIETIDMEDRNIEPEVKRAQWNAFERAIIKDREKNKLYDIILKGLYIPDWQKELKLSESEQAIDFDYVYLPFSNISDDQIEVTDAEVAAYLKKNKELYQQEAYRNMEYVSFQIKASPEDSAKLMRDLETLKTEFESTDNDSIFLRLNSEENYIDKYYTKEEIASEEVKSLFEAETGSIIGPYVNEEMFKYTKLLDKKKIADSVKLRQIVFDFNTLTSEEQAAKKRALHDSVYMLLDSFNMDFNTLVNSFSDDAASKANGGDIGWLKIENATEAQKRLYFNRGGKGAVKREILLNENKLRIVEITEYTPSTEMIKIGNLSKMILPSEKTEVAIYGQASKFASENRTAEAFSTGAEEIGKQVTPVGQIEETASFIPTVGYQARQIVRWLFDEKTNAGDVSRVFSTSEMHLVAHLTEKGEEGTKPLEKVETEIRTQLLREKKGKELAKQISEAGSTLQEISSSLGAQVGTATGLKSTNAMIPDAGWELNVVHAALNLPEGELSNPIIGNGGAYIIQVKSKPEVASQQLNLYKQNIKQENFSSVSNNLIKAIKEDADVQDNRSKFF